MGSTDEVRRLIGARIRAGQLPSAGTHETFGRRGEGLLCACCDQPIDSSQLEYDVEVVSDLGPLATLPMHVYCYHAWHQVSMLSPKKETKQSPGWASPGF